MTRCVMVDLKCNSKVWNSAELFRYNASMYSPFPGMDPYLEQPDIWADVHTGLISELRRYLAPKLAPDYYVAVERGTYTQHIDEAVFFGRPDLSIYMDEPGQREPALPLAGVGVVDILLPVEEEVKRAFLRIRRVDSKEVVTVIELLSPANKIKGKGRTQYVEKRQKIFETLTNLVEIDLLRIGAPMAFVTRQPMKSDYRILVSRSHQRPRGQLYPFSMRDTIPSFSLPLLPGENEPLVELNQILHELYDIARYDLQIDYSRPPSPVLKGEDKVWAKECIKAVQR